LAGKRLRSIPELQVGAAINDVIAGQPVYAGLSFQQNDRLARRPFPQRIGPTKHIVIRLSAIANSMTLPATGRQRQQKQQHE
jgi:hypothetical protein